MSRELKDKRAALISQARALVEVAEKENRDLTSEEQAQYDELMASIDALKIRIERGERLAALGGELNEREPRRNSALPTAPNFNPRTGVGDNEVKATAFYVKTGDRRALAGLDAEQRTEFMAASNDTDMNVGTDADGGVLVPTGHFNGIIAKRNEKALFPLLGVTPYNGMRGTTANVPIETGSANEFVSTAESPGTVDRDAPVLDKVQLTLVDFTKSLELTNDLREMEDSNLMTFLTGYAARALALTHNKALITEALANGTSVALSTAAAVAAGDPELITYALQAEYADTAKWVMRRATLGAFKKLQGDPFLYKSTPAGRELAEFPLFQSSFLEAIGAGNKSCAFGAWEYMGMRETPLTFLYDPYSKAGTGRVMLHYRTRIVYKVTNADAILYGTHPTA